MSSAPDPVQVPNARAEHAPGCGVTVAQYTVPEQRQIAATNIFEAGDISARAFVTGVAPAMMTT
ncbi:hypothetical protein [Luteitalea sp.]|uniref:hypothetical protein n=1 Tax=Luteitalea sp. TaxID=2004800 RepID=UPI0037CAF385